MSKTDVGPISQPIFREIGPAHRERAYPWKPPRTRAFAVTGAIGAHVLLSLAEGVGLIWRLRLLDTMLGDPSARGPALMAEARSSDLFVQSAAQLGLLTLLPCYILAGIWIYRVACNVRALGARRLQSTPGWAVGWFAVPIMGWFRPFRDVSEIWKASRAPLAWSSERTPNLLGFWWAAWVVANLTGNASGIAALGSGTMPGLLNASRIQLAFHVIDIISAALFLVVVWRITKVQTTTRRGAQSTAEIFA